MKETTKAKVAIVDLGFTQIEGLMLPDGTYGISESQIAELLPKSFPLDERLENLLGLEFHSTESVNYMTFPEFFNFCYKLSVSGKDKDGKAYDLALDYYNYHGNEDKVFTLKGVKALEKSNHYELSKRTPKQRKDDIKEKFSILWNCDKDVEVNHEGHSIVVTVTTYIGKVNLSNNSFIAEIDECKNWKHAIGRILTYNVALDKPEKWLILFKAGNKHSKEYINRIAKNLGIKVKIINH